MEVYLYNQSSDKNVLNKTLGSGTSINGTIKDESNLVNPEIILSRNVTSAFNYLYIPAFNRYYYVTDKILEHQRTIIQCHVDVLMSFKSSIKNCTIIAERSSSNFNMYQVDNEMGSLNYKILATKSFPNGFNNQSGSAYLLATNGG